MHFTIILWTQLWEKCVRVDGNNNNINLVQTVDSLKAYYKWMSIHAWFCSFAF